MESRITLHATLEEMERLFDDTQGGFLVKYYEQTEQNSRYDTFKVIMRHGESVGRQDGKVFDYQSFMNKFDNLDEKNFLGRVHTKESIIMAKRIKPEKIISSLS